MRKQFRRVSLSCALQTFESNVPHDNLSHEERRQNMADTPDSNSPSRTSTPNPRFTSQAPTAEDLLKEQTVGLVHLSDFRKRRAEALDLVSRDVTPAASGATTPDGR